MTNHPTQAEQDAADRKAAQERADAQLRDPLHNQPEAQAQADARQKAQEAAQARSATPTPAKPQTPPSKAPEGMAALVLSVADLPTAYVGAAYTGSLQAVGGHGPYTFVASPSSFNGLEVRPDGQIVGTVQTRKDMAFQATVSDSAGHTAVAQLSIKIG